MRARVARRGAAAGRRGFTMVEVLVSMVLIALILPVAMEGVSLALRAASLARQRSLAVSLAETEMADLITSASWDQSSLQGDFPDNPDYHWTAEVSEWSGASVQQLEVDVLWTSNGQERSVTLDTLVYTSSGGTTGP
jgi:general secretion pathway protein I